MLNEKVTKLAMAGQDMAAVDELKKGFFQEKAKIEEKTERKVEEVKSK